MPKKTGTDRDSVLHRLSESRASGIRQHLEGSNGSNRKIPVSSVSPNIEKIDEILSQPPDPDDWKEDTARTEVHVHLPQPSQPDSDPPPPKRHAKKKLAATIIGVLVALTGLIQQLAATGWFRSHEEPRHREWHRQKDGGE